VRAIGRAAVELGAGRAKIDDRIDPRVGFLVTARPGMPVRAGDPLATVYAADAAAAHEGVSALLRAIPIVQDPPGVPLPLVSHRVTIDGVSELP